MSLKWTALSLLALGVLTVGSLVLFEVTVHPSSTRRQEVANVVWAIAGVVFVAILAANLARGKKGRPRTT
jgi:hypothetical protein